MHKIPIAIALMISLLCGSLGWIALTRASESDGMGQIFEDSTGDARATARQTGHDSGSDRAGPVRSGDRPVSLTPLDAAATSAVD